MYDERVRDILGFDPETGQRIENSEAFHQSSENPNISSVESKRLKNLGVVLIIAGVSTAASSLGIVSINEELTGEKALVLYSVLLWLSLVGQF